MLAKSENLEIANFCKIFHANVSQFQVCSGFTVCSSCRSCQEFSREYMLAKSASIQPRTDPPKFQVSLPPKQFGFILISHRTAWIPRATIANAQAQAEQRKETAVPVILKNPHPSSSIHVWPYFDSGYCGTVSIIPPSQLVRVPPAHISPCPPCSSPVQHVLQCRGHARCRARFCVVQLSEPLPCKR